MRRVHAIFFDLQPVAFPQGRRTGNLPVAGKLVSIEDRKIRLLIRRPHIRKDQAGIFAHRIGAVKQPVFQRAVGRLAGGLDDRAVDVEQPAVIAAADALVADQAKFERGAAVRAMQFKEADGAALVAKRNQVFAENPQPPRQLAEFAGEDDRLPEAPQIFAARGTRPDAGQLLVLRRSLAMVIGAVGLIQKRRSLGHYVSPSRAVVPNRLTPRPDALLHRSDIERRQPGRSRRR